MEYRFGFERKHLIILGSGILLSSLLIFVAGVLVGVSLGSPEGAKALKDAAQLAADQAEKAAQNAAAQAAALAAKNKNLAPLVQQLQPTAKADTASAPAASAAVATPQPPPAAPSPAVRQVAPVAASSAGASAAAAPPLELAAMPSTDGRPPEQDIYSIQLGSFPDAKAARELQNDMREHGYRAEIFTAADSEHREWHAVRIGGFATLASASAAAATFTGRERIQALVRRSNAL